MSDHDDVPAQDAPTSANDDSVRMRLANDLHDGLLQYVIAARMMNEAMRNQFRTLSANVPAEIELVENHLQQAIEEGRRLIEQLHSGQTVEFDVADVLSRLARELSDEGRIDCEIHLEGTAPQDAAVREVLVRVAQEAVSNIRRHSEAKRARLSLICTSDRVTLEVSDDGRGFDPRSTPGGDAGHRVGLASVYRRVQALGGHCQLESSPSRGTTITIELPLAWPH
jgi:two-component system NarL family sensor kinase